MASLKYHGQGHGKKAEEDESSIALGTLEHVLKDIIKKDYPGRGGTATEGLGYDLQVLKTLVKAAMETTPRHFAKEAVESLGVL